MSVRYGREDCQHVWRYRKDSWEDRKDSEEGCVPTICIACGAYGCERDIPDPKPSKETFFGEGANGSANTNGKWENPYVNKEKETVIPQPRMSECNMSEEEVGNHLKQLPNSYYAKLRDTQAVDHGKEAGE